MQAASSLLDLNALHLPALPSWWPLAWGWWVSAAAAVSVILLVAFLIDWKRKRLAPKKTALRLLGMPAGYQTPSSAIELLRQAALCYFPREDIAHLTGHDWYVFLDNQLGQPLFVPNLTLWQKALYQKQPIEHPERLVADCYLWIDKALPPTKRSLRNLGKR
ncbi:MAG: DUF4381 domain-containing protein [Vibrio metschnikovii]|uniref:DUF4381 domain-containing protein n=2 Tax=Gammaproteobacteria TaxID=1236 RepID=UPI001C2F84AF|nr:DUF4381 domain-containing protein [Vibrio metschnikovii]MDM7486546.1 DUF4381 domain-containing protein [Vibrio metschnikovii]